MDSRKIVLKETAKIAIGVLACTGLMLGVFALLGKFNASVLIGAAIGMVLAVGNFFFMAISTAVATERACEDDAKGGKRLVQSSQSIRFLVLAVILFAFAKSGICNVVALLLPLAFLRPSMMVMQFFGKGDDA